MNSIVERLRQHALPDPHDEREVMHAPLLKEAADRIEHQAERIKELEAEIGIGHLQCIADRQKYKQELAALRQRIADVEADNARLKRQYQQATGRQPYEPDIDIDDGC